MNRFYFIIAFISLYGGMTYYFRKSDDYDSLIQIRKMFRYAIPFAFILFVLAISPTLLKGGYSSIFAFIGALLLFSPLLVIFYNLCMWRWGFRDFYDESHIDNMDYFTLYLRSFKDDDQNKEISKRIIELFNRMFCPFAVGRPFELLPPQIGAPRLYLSDNWKENVLLMMTKAQVILLRISDTENFLWEYEQVIANNYLGKTVFWIKDSKSIKRFIDGLQANHSLIWKSFDINSVGSESLAYLQDNEWFLYKDGRYSSFLYDYLNCHSELLSNNKHYLYDNGRVLKHLVSFRYDDNLMPDVPKWDWVPFAFPEAFLLLHRTEKIVSLIILCLLDIRFAVSSFDAYSAPSTRSLVWLAFCLIIRLVFMYLMGRTSRTVVWLSETWESIDYYNRIYSENNRKVLALTLAVFLGWLLIYFFE